MFRLVGRVPEGVRQPIVRAAKPSYTLGAMALLTRTDGAILLVRHSYRTGWGLPGGLVDRRERPADALVREVREEVGLHVPVPNAPVTVVDPDRQRVDFIFVVEHNGDGAESTSAEITEVRWFDSADLPDLQREVAVAIAAVDHHRGGGDAIHVMAAD